jgi:predicted tellurium resistance membrane protein TerC
MEDLVQLFLQSDTWLSLLTLTLLEIVLGIDNIIFISIISSRLPKDQQKSARTIGLLLAFVFRVALLFAISWIVGLINPLFHVGSFGVTGRDLIMLGGGLFLIAKSTHEIHVKFEAAESDDPAPSTKGFASIVTQIILLDIVFSFDSVITAVGLVDHVAIMIGAVMISLGVMLAFAATVSDFIHKHPTLKMLALAFLLMIGMVLVAEGLHFHVPKGYVYSAMAFSILVEFLNIKLSAKSKRKA